MSKIDFVKTGKTFVIAEAGVNHNGDLELAKDLIYAAKETGADAVKFQNFKANRVISSFAKKAEYQKSGINDFESQLEMLSKLELKESDYQTLVDCANKVGILFLSTPKDILSIEVLENIDISIYKIGSTEINNYEFLQNIAQTEKPIILSTGMCFLSEVEEAIEVIKNTSNSLISLLHCVSQYPCPIDQVNLQSMVTMKNAFELPVGYSDHTVGKEVVLAAVSLGAQIIEKHFTIDKSLIGPDHKVSMDVSEMTDMVSSIRAVESCLGDGIKKPADCEIDNILLLRRSLVFAKRLSKGHIMTNSDITIKRPGNGLEPKYKIDIIGHKLLHNVVMDEHLTWRHFK